MTDSANRWSCEYVRTLGLPPSWVEWHDPTSTRCDGECGVDDDEGRLADEQISPEFGRS